MIITVESVEIIVAQFVWYFNPPPPNLHFRRNYFKRATFLLKLKADASKELHPHEEIK